MSKTGERHGPQTFLAAGLTVSLGFVLVVALAWPLFALLFGLGPFGLPVLYALPGTVLVVQFVRSFRMGDWPRRAAALASVVGFFVSFAGVGPMGGCADTEPSTCSASLDPAIPVLALGVCLTTVTLAYDLHRR